MDLTPTLLLDFSVQIAQGMDHLARHNIVHRDLAARNVLITGDQRVKITDFGLSRAVPLYYRKVTPGKVPWKWLAPESLTPLDSCYSSKSDIWSFGVVLHEMFSWGKAPWPHLSRVDQLERLLHPQYGNNRMSKPMGCSNEV
jgi:serine/threonine protein kinase